jgi:hypothetical protein
LGPIYHFDVPFFPFEKISLFSRLPLEKGYTSSAEALNNPALTGGPSGFACSDHTWVAWSGRQGILTGEVTCYR